MLIFDAIDIACRTRGEKTAIATAEESLSYAELDRLSSAFAKRLRAQGIAAGDVVAVYAESTVTYVILVWACMRAGIILCHIRYGIQASAVREIFDTAGAKCLFYSTGPDNWSPQGFGSKAIVLSAALIKQLRGTETSSNTPAYISPRADQIISINCSSGTTGKPKLIAAEAGARSSSALANIIEYQLTEKDCGYTPVPTYEIFSLFSWGIPLLAIGATWWVTDGFNVDNFARWANTGTINKLHCNTPPVRSLVEHNRREKICFPDIHFVNHAGSLISVPERQQLLEIFPNARVLTTYGAAEVDRIVSNDMSANLDHIACSGRPAFGVEVALRPYDGRQDLEDGVGRIAVRTPARFREYLGQADLTEQAIDGSWFVTQDLGFLEEDGYLTVVGRIDDMVFISGQGVLPSEIEEILYQHPSVIESVVIGLPDPDVGDALVAMVQVQADAPATLKDELLTSLNSRLPAFKVPKRIDFVGQIPKNKNGKIVRRLVRDKMLALS